MMTRHSWAPLFLAFAALLGSASLAWADEDADASELLRLGRVAETVDRDLLKASRLYVAAFKAADTADLADLAFEATFALLRLNERVGKPKAALVNLRGLEWRFGDKLSDEQKLAIARAERRLEASCGITGREAPPLERKIREMFARFERAPAGESRFAEANVVRDGLKSVGETALPVLETIILESTPETAELATEMYAKLGQANALAGLERMLRGGDPLVRPALAEAFTQLQEGGEISPAVVETIDRLLAIEELGSLHQSLRTTLLSHVKAEELLERHLAGGKHASWWLAAGLEGEVPGAIERATELIREGGEVGRQAFRWLEPMLQKPSSGSRVYPLTALGREGAEQAFAWLVEDVRNLQGWQSNLPVDLARLLEELGGEEAGERARQLLWRTWREMANDRHRRALFDALLLGLYLPPADILEDPAVAELFLTDFTRAPSMPKRTEMLRWLIDSGKGFWSSFFAAADHMEDEDLVRLVNFLAWTYHDDSSLPPPTHDSDWIAVLERPYFMENRDRTPAFIWFAASRSGDARFVEAVRRYTAKHGWRVRNPYDALFKAVLGFPGEGRLGLLTDALTYERLDTSARRRFLSLLVKSEDPASRDLLVRVALDWNHRIAGLALAKLADAGARDAVMAAVERVQAAGEVVPSYYRSSLMAALKTLVLREGIPFLLEEYRRGGRLATEAAEAMDAIRAYHERLSDFEAFVEGREEERAEELKRLVTLLEDGDAEIRRAAILALTALKRTEALPRIVSMAKHDPDERVREAALRAVEQMAR